MLDRLGVGATFPPNCFVSMKAEFVSYESRRSRVLQMSAEAFNRRNKLVALATAGATVLEKSSSGKDYGER